MALNFLLKRSGTADKRPDPASMALGELDLNYDAVSGGVFYKDSAGDVVKVGSAQVSATAPNATPAGSAGNSDGEFWYDTSNTTLKIWNGSAWVSISGGGGGVAGVTGTTPITVDNTDPANPVVGVDAASTSTSGVVQLNDSTSSTSTTEAATANAVKTAYDAGIQGQTDAATAQTTANAALPKAGGTMSGVIAFDAGQTFSVTGIQDATAVAKGVVQVGTNIAVASGVISVASASTSVPGIVQLNNTTASTSITEALTAAQGKSLQDQIDALVVTSNLTLAGTFNATTGLVDSVTTAGTTAGFVVASAVPAAAAGNADYFVIIDVAGSSGPAGSAPYHVGDWFLSNGTAWTFLNVGTQAVPATTSVEGVVFLATNAEVQAGSDTSNKAVIPSSLQSKLSDSTSTTSSSTIASSTAVKSAYDLANAAVPDASYTALGAILTGTGAGTYAALTLGADTNVLTVDTTCPGGLKWAAGGGGGGSGTVTSITAGAGLTGGTITTSGTIAIDSTCVLEPADFTASGQLLAGTGTGTYTALAVGSDTQVLTADSACTGGVKWAAGGGGGGTLATPTACGVVFGCSDTNTNTSLGYTAIRDLSGASVRNVAIGVNAMKCLTTSHCCNIAIGHSAMFGSSGSANFRCNVAIGNASMANVTGSNIINNVYVGMCTAASGTGSNNVAVGFCSQSANCGSGNTSVGSTSLAINTGNNNVAVGLNAGCTLGSTAACNILIGPGAGGAGAVGSITGSANIIIGIDKAPPVPAGSTQLVLGNWLTGCSTLAIKPAAGIMDCVLSTGTAGQVLTSNGSNAIAWGAPPAAQSAVRGTVYGYAGSVFSNTAIGRDSFENGGGTCNTAMGNEALLNTVALDTDNVAIGYRAGKLLSSVCFNTAVGSCSMGAATTFGANCNTAVGYGSAGQICGVSNTAVGANALCFAVLATCNVAVGGNAGRCLSTGSCNTLLGTNTGVTVNLITGSNNTVIGFNAATAATGTSNTITLGNASITTIRAQVTTITSLSDARDKTDVTALPVGLDFVKSLNPVKFTWQMREPNEVKDGTSEAGFIAQDLKAAQEASGASYLGLIYDDNPEKLEASPGKLVPVLVKAIQELSERNDLLEARIATLEGN